MKRSALLILILAVLGLASCSKKEENKQPVAGNGAPLHTAKVLDKMDASSYTYLMVSEGNSTYWIAVTKMPVEKGEVIHFSRATEMKNFQSPTLNRTFDSILFVEDAYKDGQQSGGAMGGMQQHPQVTSAPEEVKIDPASGGKTVAQIFAQKSSLDGKTVKVRGKVTKYNPGILDRNWIHIQDGTNDNGQYDLMVTSKETTGLGEVITVEGKVAVNKDFGAGYSYPVMIEEAKISK